MEAAFAGPRKIADRMGGFDIGKIAAADPAEFDEFSAEVQRRLAGSV